ncbi:MAG: hypothetical protein Q8L10_02140 [Candidatus Moranbacteria bacterium]|nr:hypothetical protein [Candidatus Moranbacteria bacterium]
MANKILLGLTTTSGSDYKAKIDEAEALGIEEVALFLSGVGLEKRKELYRLLENSSIKSIPHVHLRDDMLLWELEYLEKKFAVKVFNIHNKNDVRNFSGFDFGRYRDRTYVENSISADSIPDEEELENFAGLCIDFSHWQDAITLGVESYDGEIRKMARKFPIGCAHISAVGAKISGSRDATFPDIVYSHYSKHFFDDLDEFDYLGKYVGFIPELVSLELENSFEEQLEAKGYIEKIIQGNKE